MGIKDNFSQAMKELTNPRSSDNRKEVKDVAAYMNDTADTQPGEPAQNAQPAQDNVQPSQDRKSTRLNSSHSGESRMPSSA